MLELDYLMELTSCEDGDDSLDEDLDWDDEIEEENSQEKKIGWYSARTYVSNEDRIVEQLWDKIRQHKLTDKIKEIISFKEFVVKESAELSPDSPELPKTEFRSSKTSIWVTLKNGNFKKIRLQIRRPFKCFIFLKMFGDPDLFAQIHKWALGLNFLGFPRPNIISDFEFQKMSAGVNKEVPNLSEYIEEHGYKIAKGSVPSYVKKYTAIEYQTTRRLEAEEALQEENPLDSAEKDFVAKEEVSEFIEAENFIPTEAQERKDVVLEQLKINDFVYLSEMGAKGIVEKIDLENQLVTIKINLFGRNQILDCKVSQLKEF